MKVKKIIICFMLFISIFNFIYPTIVSADESDDEISKYFDNASVGGALLDGLIGILTYVQRIEVLLVGTALNGITSAVAHGEGTVTGATLTDEEHVYITPGTILFNKINITDVNIFDTDTDGAAINNIRISIRNWYWVTFTLSAIILVLILIYIGIRMAISTIAEKKAVYQKMLTNWFVSMVVLFMLHFIIRATLFVNTQLVKIFANTPGVAVSSENMYLSLQAKALLPAATVSWASVIVFFCLVILTLMFLFIYIKRMLTVCFLVVIAPLITVTYSIDKIGDNKSQALDTWLKEFMFGVLIQPFHCIVYMVFVSTAIELTETGTFSSIVLALMMMFFIMKAEGIVRKIFGFEKSSSLSGAIGAAAAVGAGMNAAKNLIKPPAKKGADGKGSAANSSTNTSAAGAGGTGGSSGSQNLSGQRGSRSTSMPSAASLNMQKGKISNAINSVKNKAGGVVGKVKNTGAVQGASRFFSNTKVGQMASKAGKGVGKFVGGTYKRSLKGSAAGGLMGAMTAGMVSGGDSTAVVGGYMAGSALSSGVKGNVSNKIEERRDAREERENNALLAGAYANLKESGGYTDAQMSEMTNNLLNDQEGLYNMARINGESEEDWFNRTATAEEKQLEKDGEYGKDVWRDRMAYSQSLYATQSRYESRGLSSEASADKVMDTIKQVQSGRISSKGSTEANYNSAKKDEVSAERKRRADEVAGYMDSMWE